MNKSIIIGIMAVVLVSGGLFLFSNQSGKDAAMQKEEVMQKDGEETATDKMKDEKMMGTGVVFKNGAIVLEEGSTMSPLTKAYVFPETGITVSLAGKVMKKDGTTVQLKEGESVWADGAITKAGEMMKKDEGAMMDKSDVMMKAGSYEAYAPGKVMLASATHDVVLFFRASWCPMCRAVDADIKMHLKDIPADLTILDVNYDDSSALKAKYGVTYQHTFVEVDAQGKQIKKWSGSPTLAALVAEVN